MKKVKCAICSKLIEKPIKVQGHVIQPDKVVTHKCKKCGKEVCLDCFERITNRTYGYCKECFKGLDIIKPLDLSNPSLRIQKVQLIETVDFPETFHVARKIGTLKVSIEYIKRFFESPSYGSSPIDAVYTIYTQLRNWKWKDLKNLDIYFGFMNDKYWYHEPRATNRAIRTLFLDTVYLVSSDIQLLQKLHDIFDTEIIDDGLGGEKIVYVGSGKDATNDAIFDEVSIIDFPDKRKCLLLWCD